MAEIRIQKKRPIGPWIAGIVAVLFVLWLIIRALDRDMKVSSVEQPVSSQDTLARTQIPTEVEVFLDFATEKQISQVAENEIQYTSEGIRKLGGALQAITARDNIQNINVDQKIASMESKADFVENNPSKSLQVDSVRSAFILAALWMERLQIEYYPELDERIKVVKSVAENMVQEQANQNETIQEFFNRSGEVIRLMAIRDMDQDVMVRSRRRYDR